MTAVWVGLGIALGILLGIVGGYVWLVWAFRNGLH